MKKRETWLDVLRILSAFLVIVNHTNSDVFRSVTPQNGTWWVSVLWYALSKVAVPMFVMVSGACLLGREDSWSKCFGRFVRMVAVLVAFSFLYYGFECWQSGQAIRADVLARRIWKQDITDSFWYLYFYAGLMLMLPMLQRLSCAMRGRDTAYLVILCLGFGAFAPLLAYLKPAFKLPTHFDVPLFSTYIGLCFAGWWIRKSAVPRRSAQLLCVAAVIACMAASVALLRRGYTPDVNYWYFMDDRMHPGFLIAIAAIALTILCKGLFSSVANPRIVRLLGRLGGCAFGIYLLQDWLIAETELRIFLPLCNVLPAFPAVVVWELAVFVMALAITWVIRLIPGVKKLI